MNIAVTVSGLDFMKIRRYCTTAAPGTGVELVPGMVFTIEPMINLGRRETILSKTDGWTVTTRDRSLSAQWEHTIAVTEDGYDVLTRLPEDEL